MPNSQCGLCIPSTVWIRVDLTARSRENRGAHNTVLQNTHTGVQQGKELTR